MQCPEVRRDRMARQQDRPPTTDEPREDSWAHLRGIRKPEPSAPTEA